MYFSFIFFRQFLQYDIYPVTINMRVTESAHIVNIYIIKKMRKIYFHILQNVGKKIE